MMTSDIPDWAKSCPTQKMKFATSQDAKAFLRARKGPAQHRGNMQPYLCQTCDSYHLTSQTSTEIRRKRKRAGKA
jgi:hypothetical protein